MASATMTDPPLTPDQIERLRGLLEEATFRPEVVGQQAGPWHVHEVEYGELTIRQTVPTAEICSMGRRALNWQRKNAALIVALRNAAPALLDAAAAYVRWRVTGAAIAAREE